MTQHVLVVDDDPLQCRTAELIIKGIPRCTVTIAVGGEEALRIFDATTVSKFDAVLLDLSMPHVNGMDVLQHIRSLSQDIPVIMYTAYGDIKKAVAAIKLGATDFIEKQDGPDAA